MSGWALAGSTLSSVALLSLPGFFWAPLYHFSSYVPSFLLSLSSLTFSSCLLTTILPIPLLQGIVGNLSSGKSALVHRYLTGTYVQEESPEGEHHKLGWPLVASSSTIISVRGSGSSPGPFSSLLPWAPRLLLTHIPMFPFSAFGPDLYSVLGGRFKKEIVVDGQSYLLLIRDEGGPPELQVMLLLTCLPSVRVHQGRWVLTLFISSVCCLGGCGGVCVQPGG